MTDPIHPTSVRIEATASCQLRCPSCPTATGETRAVLGRGFLRFDDFKTFIERNPGLTTIELSNYGEVFLNPQFLQILEFAHQRGLRLTAENGSNLNTVPLRVLEGLVKYGFRQLRVSIDGASQETYVQYRVGGDFATVIGNVRTINRFKRRYRSESPRLIWQFILFGHNEHEVDAARRMARRLGMEFRLKLAWGDFSPVRDVEEIKRATGLGVASRQEYAQTHGRDYMQATCHQLWDSPQINWDGKLLGCCRNFWGTFGDNVFEKGLEAALNGEKISYARQMLLGQRPSRDDIPCTTCGIYAQMQQSGQWLHRKELSPGWVHAVARWLYYRSAAVANVRKRLRTPPRPAARHVRLPILRA